MRWMYVLISVLLLTSCSNGTDITDLQEGDVVFVENQSS